MNATADTPVAVKIDTDANLPAETIAQPTNPAIGTYYENIADDR